MNKKTVTVVPNSNPSLGHVIAKSIRGLALTLDKCQSAPVGESSDSNKLAMWFLSDCVDTGNGNYNLEFLVGFEGKKFSWRDERQRVTQASVDFKVQLNNCRHDSEKGWIWADAYDYSFDTDKEVATLVYFRNECVNPVDDDDFPMRAIGLAHGDNESLSTTMIVEVVNNTTREQLIETFKMMLTSVNAP